MYFCYMIQIDDKIISLDILEKHFFPIPNATFPNIYPFLKSISFSNSITYGPHTIAAMHAVFSGSYGCRTGTNSYWSTYKFKKNKFKTLTEYLKEEDFVTHADVINQLVILSQVISK